MRMAGEKTQDLHTNPIGIYGWRKRCLYFFLLLLVVIIVVNLGLTIWILIVLRFNVVSHEFCCVYMYTSIVVFCFILVSYGIHVGPTVCLSINQSINRSID